MGIDFNMGVITIIFTVLVISKTLDLLIEVVRHAVSVVVYDPVVLEKNREITRLIINSLLKEVDRVMLLKMDSFDVVREIMTTSEFNYDYFIPDRKYLKIISYIKSTNKPYTFTVEEEEDSILKEVYLREGIKHSKIYFIKTDKGSIIKRLLSKVGLRDTGGDLIFLSLANKDRPVDIEAVSLLTKINKLKRVL